MSTPVIPGPKKPAIAGAKAIQLKILIRCVALTAMRPAVRCIAIIPKPEPAPLKAAANSRPNKPSHKVTIITASKDMPAAILTGL